MKTTITQSLMRTVAAAFIVLVIAFPLSAQGPGTALQLNGSSQYVNLGNSSDYNLTSGFTVEAWIKVNTFNKDWQAVVTKGDQTWRLHRNVNTNVMGFGTNHNPGSVPNDLVGVTPVNDGQWHHVAAVYNGSTKSLYVDGKLDASVSTSGTLRTDTQPVYIGENAEQSNRHFNGSIDEVRIWNSARTQTQIRQNMHRTLNASAEANLVSYYKFNNGSGSTATDSKGSHNGTLVNSPSWITSPVALADSTIVSSVSGFNGASTTLGNIALSFTNQFDAAVDIVAHEIPVIPNSYPTEASAFQGTRYWVINVYGSPGTFSADVTFTYPSGELNTGLSSSSISLFKRSGNSDGAWTSVVTGAAIYTSTGAKFNGVTSFSQFAVSANTMTYVSSTVSQNSASLVKGSVQQQVIGIAVVTSGVTSPMNATAFSLSTNGTTSVSDISNACLYYTGTSNAFAAVSQFGSAAASPNGSFSFSGTQALATGTNYFWLTYDISSSAVAGNLIDAECSQITVGGINRTPSVTAPSGSRQVLDMTVPGSAISLNAASSQCVEIADNDDLDLTTAYTIEAWIRPGSFSSSAGIVSKYQTSGANGYILRLNPSSPYTGITFDEVETGNGLLSSNQWYHIAAVNDNGTKSIYINGVLVGSAGGSFNAQSNSDPVKIGCDFSDRFFDGQIDEVQIWNVARSAQDIRSSMHRTLSGSETGLVGYWQFNELTGDAADAAHGFNGTLQNGASRTASTIPAGEGVSNVVNDFSSGTANLGDISFATTESFDNDVQLVGTTISYKPSSYPSGTSSVPDSDKYFVVNVFGLPGSFTGNLTLTFGAGAVTAGEQSDPSQLILYRRNSTSDGTWQSVASASSANSLTGSVTFNGITSFSQFFVGHDSTAPTVVSFSPADNGSAQSTDSLVITFSENVLAGSGNITIRNSDNSVFEQIAATNSSLVTFSGATVTINPSSDLLGGNDYHVFIDNGAIKDVAGNNYTGIANAATWNFSVITVHFGGGGSGNGGYYFANSTSGASNAPSQPSYGWITETTDSVLIGTPSSGDPDDGYWGPFALPFSFTFFGTSYNAVFIGTNGVISFSSGTGEYANKSIPTAGSPNRLIALCWDDMITNGTIPTSIYYGGNTSQFVITYHQLVNYTDNDQYITAQVILYSNGDVKLQYNDALSSANKSSFVDGCTVGIENGNGTQGIQYRYNGTGGPMFGSNLAVMFSQNNSALPVELASFTANANGKSVELKWNTATELNNAGFEIERTPSQTLPLSGGGQGGGQWSRIGFVEGHGTTNAPQSYSFVDANAKGKVSYRLKQIDRDGKFQYSQSVEVVVGQAPSVFALSQNYPNPFNPATTIEFTVPVTGKATLKIYNAIGQEVATLFDQDAEAGTYNKVQFNASGLATGVYFSRLEHDGKIQLKKMLLMK